MPLFLIPVIFTTVLLSPLTAINLIELTRSAVLYQEPVTSKSLPTPQSATSSQLESSASASVPTQIQTYPSPASLSSAMIETPLVTVTAAGTHTDRVLQVIIQGLSLLLQRELETPQTVLANQTINTQTLRQIQMQADRIYETTSDSSASLRQDLTDGGFFNDASFSGNTFMSGALAIGSSTADSMLTVSGTSTFAQIVATDILTSQLQTNSVFIPTSIPVSTVSRLYNTAGDLYWNGSLIAGSAVGNWNSSLSGDVYRLTGNVGLGTTTPAAKISVVVPNVNTFISMFSGFSNSYGGFWNSLNNGVNLSLYNTTGTPTHMFRSYGDSFINTGNVGLGTTTPSARLSVVGDINLTGKAFVNGTQALFIPGGDFIGTMVMGDGGQNLTYTAGNNGRFNTFVGLGAGSANTTGEGNSATGNQSLYSNTTGSNNSAIGYQSLYSNTTGNSNSAIGYHSLHSNTTGSNNSAIGYQSLYSNTTGNSNSAIGYHSLHSNTTGSNNSAIGYQSLHFNTTGSNNSAMGREALYFNTTGSNNLAMGREALYSNTTGSGNSATGYRSLYSNTVGSNNSATGYRSLYSNTTGNSNSAIGYQSLHFNTTGSNNSAMGREALYFNTTGSNNLAMGREALYSNTTGSGNSATGNLSLYSNTIGNNNSAMGREALYSNTIGNNNSAIGYQSLHSNTTGINNVAIGATAGLDLNILNSTGNNVFIGNNTGRGIVTGINNTILGANVTGLSAALNNNIVIADGSGNRRINVDASGNVGIGTTLPTQVLSVQGNSAVSGWGRVGSFINPVNNLSGDFTVSRLSVGNISIAGMGQGGLVSVSGSMTSLSGADSIVGLTAFLEPGAASSVNARTFSTSLRPDTTFNLTGAGFNGLSAAWFENRVVNAADITQINGLTASGLWLSSTALSLGTVSEATASLLIPVVSFSNTLSSTVTKAVGLSVLNSVNNGTGGLTIAGQVGLQVEALTSGVNNTALLLGQTTVPIGNFGIYSGTSNSSYFAGNVGIGTTTPNTQLTIAGSGAHGINLAADTGSPGDSGRLFFSNNSGSFALVKAINNLNFNYGAVPGSTTGTTALSITNTGKVGIGTPAPSHGLTIVNNSATSTLGIIGSANGQNAALFLGEDGSSGGGLQYFSDGNRLSVYTGIGGVGGGAERMTFLRDSGNVGIGITNPTVALDVAGIVRIGSPIASGIGALTVKQNGVTQGNGISFETGSGTATGRLFLDSGNNINLYRPGIGNIVLNTDSGSVILSANGAPTLSAVSSGNVGIGTTTPRQKLEVAGHLQLSNDGNQGSVFGVDRLIGFDDIRFYADNIGTSELMRVTSSGRVGIGTTTPESKLSVAGDVQASGLILNAPGSFVKLDGVAKIADNNKNFWFGLGSENPYFNIQRRNNDTYVDTPFGINWNTGFVSVGAGVYPSERLHVDGSALIGAVSGGAYSGNIKLMKSDRFPALVFRSGFVDKAQIVSDLNTGSYVMDYSGDTGGNFSIRKVVNSDSDTVFRISSAGNVGIGTTSPSSKLTVENGNILIRNNGYSSLLVQGFGTTSSSPSTIFSRARGTTGSPLVVQAGDSLGEIQGRGWDGTSFAYAVSHISILAAESFTPTSMGSFLKFSTTPIGSVAGLERMVILSDGNVGIGTSSPTATLAVAGTVRFSNFGMGGVETDALGNITVSSDERLKDIQGNYTAGLEAVIGLQPIRYNWNAKSGYDRNTIYSGFSAQNVRDFIPDAVGVNPNGYLTLSDRPILAAVVNAIKELWGEMTNLKQQIDEDSLAKDLEIQNLKDRLSNLEASLQVALPVAPPQADDVPEENQDPENTTVADEGGEGSSDTATGEVVDEPVNPIDVSGSATGDDAVSP